ncbi:MAG: hypothetical protein M1818_004103 [Claussenomyces sp. TS43310]|nr:MAG: hypothetical protein M1818_004103 [Claussenomyces sp. TS43310]
MDFIGGVKLSDILRDPARPNQPILNPEIHPDILKSILDQIADIMLQMYQFDFRKIGAIKMDGAVRYRPLTYNDNELITLTDGFPQDVLPSQPLSSTTQYLQSLADRHITHLKIQRNIAETDDACREMYIARHLYKQLIKQATAQHSSENGPFKLFCDYIRPANMLVDPETLQITAVIDWEYSYAAPAQYSQCPPPWLLLVSPETLMRRGYTINEFEALYTPVLEAFLTALEEKEVARGWVLAARESFDVDDIFKPKLDGQYSGHYGGAALELIECETARKALPAFLEQKRIQYGQYCQDLEVHQAQRAANNEGI